MTYLQLWAVIPVCSFIWKGYKRELKINKPVRLVDSCWCVHIQIFTTTNWHSPAAVLSTKTNRARTKMKNVAEVLNRLVWPIIDELVKLSAISCSRCFYYCSTFSCTGVTRRCVAQTRHSWKYRDDILHANLMCGGRSCRWQPGEFHCKAAVDWMTWASRLVLAHGTWLAQKNGQTPLCPTEKYFLKPGASFRLRVHVFKHPSMDVNYKRKECLWSKSPGYFFFLATLRPPQLLLGTSYYRRWTNHRGLWMTVANERLV